MSFEYLIDPGKGPRWKGVLPGRPAPYVLRRGQGEHAMLFGDLFTVLLSGDETDGQFGIITSECPPGKLIPTHVHAGTHETFYVLEGKERFFQHMGTLTDHPTTEQPPFVPDFPRMQAAAQQHSMRFMPDYEWWTAGDRA